MKPLKNKKKYKKEVIYTLVIANLIIWFCAYTTASLFYSHYVEVVTAYISEPIQTARAEVKPEPVKKELTTKEYVRQEVEKANLNWNEVSCLIEHESNWNEWAQGVNNDKSTDSGLWQINSLHKGTIPLKDRFDVKKATKWAIEKRLHDGSWSAWYGYQYNCK